jgi:hypothetical protein
MSVVRRTVVFEESVAAELERRAGKQGFSSLVNEVVEQYLQSLRIEELYADFVRTNGPVPEDIRRAVADEWAAIEMEPVTNVGL